MKHLNMSARHALPIVVVGVFAVALVLIPTAAFAARTVNSFTVDGGSSTTVAPGTSITVNVSVTTTGSGEANDWESTQYLIEGGNWVCVNTPDHTNGAGTYSESFSITAPTNNGTYDLSIRAYNNGSCINDVSNTKVLNNAITVQDHLTITNVEVNNTTHVTVTPNTIVSLKTHVTTFGSGENNDWESTRYRIGSGSWICVNTTDHTSNGSYTETFNITAPSSPNTYPIDVRVYDNDSCSSGESDTYTLSNAITVEQPTATISAQKIICDNESDLPNWGLGGSNITATTATSYVANHAGCHLADWTFQWRPDNTNPYNPGDNTGAAGGAWSTPFATTANIATNVSKIWVREVWNTNYIPFTYEVSGNSNNISAEFYCNTDVVNYDNLEWIDNLQAGHTYYCVGFNVLKPVCGDGKVNQSTEQCDGTDGVTTNVNVCTDSCTLTALQTSFDITKSVLVNGVYAATAKEGDTLTYTITAKNTGETNETGLYIKDSLPTNTTLVANSWAGDLPAPAVDGTNFTWGPFNLNAGTNAAVSFQVTVNSGLPNGETQIKNQAELWQQQASVQTEQPVGLLNRVLGIRTASAAELALVLKATSVQIITTVTKTAEVVPPVVTAPVLTLAKTVGQTFANPGSTVTYTLTVTNTGSAPATNVVLTDTLPIGMTFVDTGKTTQTWSLANLLPGESLVKSYKVKLDNALIAGMYTNSASVTADTLNPVSTVANLEVRTVQVLGAEDTIVQGAEDELPDTSGANVLVIFGSALIAGSAFIAKRSIR